jgi:DNA-binding NarL/FixJ family response regulator
VEELVNAIIEVWQGRRFLSKKVEEIIKQGNDKAVVLTNVEKNILRLLCNGCTNSEIAEQLHLSIETVNWYRKRLLAKYGAKNTASLVSRVIKEKIV